MQNILNREKLRNDYLTNIIGILKQRRIEAGLTLAELNTHMGFPNRTLQEWESGIRLPTVFHLCCWAHALSLDIVVRQENEEPYKPVKKHRLSKAVNDNRLAVIN